MRKFSLQNLVYISLVILFFAEMTLAHEGSHGNDECIITVDKVDIRLNGYQFKGRNPDKHYCRHYPHLGQTIIKIDSTSTDLTGMGMELQLLKRNSWKNLILGTNKAFITIKKMPIQYFSKQVVSIENNIQSRDLYAIKIRLHENNGRVSEQQFIFSVGIPFVQVLVGIAILLLIFISFIFLKQLKKA